MHLVYFSKEVVKFIGHAPKVILVHRGLELDDHQIFVAQDVIANDEVLVAQKRTKLRSSR